MTNTTLTSGWLYNFPVPHSDLKANKVFVNGRTMVVLWSDGTRTQSTASELDTFDPEVGFAICLMKKTFGRKVHGKRLYRRIVSHAMLQDVDDDVAEAVENWRFIN